MCFNCIMLDSIWSTCLLFPWTTIFKIKKNKTLQLTPPSLRLIKASITFTCRVKQKRKLWKFVSGKTDLFCSQIWRHAKNIFQMILIFLLQRVWDDSEKSILSVFTPVDILQSVILKVHSLALPEWRRLCVLRQTELQGQFDLVSAWMDSMDFLWNSNRLTTGKQVRPWLLLYNFEMKDVCWIWSICCCSMAIIWGKGETLWWSLHVCPDINCLVAFMFYQNSVWEEAIG